MLGHRLGERGVVLAAEGVGLGERDVEDDGARLLRREPFNELGMHYARPGPAAGFALHAREALLVDVDEHDIGVRRELRRLRAHEAVEEPVLQRLQRVQCEELDAHEREHAEREQRERALHRALITSRSAWQRSMLASISSRLIDTLSTLTPSGISAA